jgi:non-homologous end joining protein Ku
MSLIEKMSSEDFEPERYADEYRERALAMIEPKARNSKPFLRRHGAAVRSSTSSRR